MEKLKEWLEKYRVFFEILATLALTVASLVVSFSANRIADKQRRLEEALSKPIINLSASYEEKSNDIVQVSIVNSGSTVFDLQVKTFPYLEAIVYPTENKDIVCMALPIEEKWPEICTFTEMTGAKTGELAIVRNASPSSFSVVLSGFFNKKEINTISMSRATKISLQTLTPKYYLVISYTDVIGEGHIEIYDVELQRPSLYSGLVPVGNMSTDIRLLSPGSSDFQIAETLFKASCNNRSKNSIVYYSPPLYSPDEMMTDKESADFFTILLQTLRESYDKDHFVIW